MAFDRLKLVDAGEKLNQFFDFCHVTSGGKKALLDSLNSDFKDKEDGIQYFTAIKNQMDFFLTRNKNGFKKLLEKLQFLTQKNFLGID